MRHSDFDTVSAIGEVIDNSIQAEATNIRIMTQKVETRKPHYRFVEMAFGDDGIGMNPDTLHKCLVLGYSSRYNDRSGIGRFGVGMILGAISQCRHIEVYSKTKGGEWYYTFLEIGSKIPPPIRKNIPEDYSDLIANSGTLVIWKKLDMADARSDDLIKWIGRTYRKFIGKQTISNSKVVQNPNQRHIFLDGKEIPALDPLYATQTKYGDEVSKLAGEISIPMKIHTYDPPPDKQHGTSPITIRLSLLPQSWWEKEGSGGTIANKDRQLVTSTSFSILRNDREVMFGKIPHYSLDEGDSREIDRFWGCEISFNADLDRWFKVKTIKVGARPLPEMREIIQKHVNSTIYDYRKLIRKVREDQKTKKQEVIGNTASPELAEQWLQGQSDPLPPDDQEVASILKAAGVENQAQNDVLFQQLTDKPYVIHENYNLGSAGPFVDIVSEGNRTLLQLNMLHPFWKLFFDSFNKLDTISPNLDKSQILALKHIKNSVYVALGTFAIARREFNADQQQNAEVIKRLMRNWTFYLYEKIEGATDKDPE